MQLNEAGLMVEKWWNKLSQKFSGTLTDSVRIMPNHLHAVFVILGNGMDMASLFGLGLDYLDFDGAEDNEGIVSSLAPTRGGSGRQLGSPAHSATLDPSRRTK